MQYHSYLIQITAILDKRNEKNADFLQLNKIKQTFRRINVKEQLQNNSSVRYHSKTVNWSTDKTTNKYFPTSIVQ